MHRLYFALYPDAEATEAIVAPSAELRRRYRMICGPVIRRAAPEIFVDPVRWTVRDFVLIHSVKGQGRHGVVGR